MGDTTSKMGPSGMSVQGPSGAPHTHTALFTGPGGVALQSDLSEGVALKSDLSEEDAPYFSCEETSTDGSEPRSDVAQEHEPPRCGVCEQVLLKDRVIPPCGHCVCEECSASTTPEQAGSREDSACPLCTKEKRAIVVQSVVQDYKDRLKKRFEHIRDGGTQTLLRDVYAELHSTEGESEEDQAEEHEVWRVEQASKVQTEPSGTAAAGISCNDIFKASPGREAYVKTVLTTGVAGVGKTVSVHKFVLDWAEGRANQDVEFVFVLPFRILNLTEHTWRSLQQLLTELHPELAELTDPRLYEECKVVLVLDGLDESQLALSFQPGYALCDTNSFAAVDVLVANLVQGNLLPSAHVWITSRPAAADQIPAKYVDRYTEIRGFRDPQKEEYLRKRIADEPKVDQIMSHIKSCRSLHIMCQIPAVCSIVATVTEHMLGRDDGAKLPQTLTELVTQLLLRQVHLENEMFEGEEGTDAATLLEYKMDVIVRLSELAFTQLQQQCKLWLYEDDLMACGFRVGDATVYSVIFREIFCEEDCRLKTQQAPRVFGFAHLSVLEFLAAFFVIHCAASCNTEPLETFLRNTSRDQHSGQSGKNRKGVLSSIKHIFEISPSEKNNLQNESEDAAVSLGLLKSIVDRVVETADGHMDHFLRFLMGLCLESSQELLLGLLPETCPDLKKVVEYVRALLDTDIAPDRCISLLRSLAEVKDDGVHSDVQKNLRLRRPEEMQLSPAFCSTLAHQLLQSEEVVEELDLRKYNASDRGRRRLIPVVRCCRKAVLVGCELDGRSLERVILCVHSLHYPLRELDLSGSELQDSWMMTFSSQLKSATCRLETLRLSCCALTDTGCAFLSSVLSSPGCALRVLDLSHNQLQDKGAMLLSAQLDSPLCRLETLRISSCGFTDAGCVCLASAVRSPYSPLNELDLRGNHLKETTTQKLLITLQDPHCLLHTLRLDNAAILWVCLGPVQYASELTLDRDTAHRHLLLSDDLRQVTHSAEAQPHPARPQRFQHRPQVLCSQPLSHCRCYWETAWSQDGGVSIGVAYGSIHRKGWSQDQLLGYNDQSWCLFYSHGRYSAWHDRKQTVIPENRVPVQSEPKPGPTLDQSVSSPAPRAPISGPNRVGSRKLEQLAPHHFLSKRVGVYLDWLEGTLSFYSVSSDTLTRLHAFRAVFTEPVYPAFRLREMDSSLILC
ncbi:NLR family CARD domain-containing protein 3-like [Alosa sapidissima]|uniref:NLR family CARD domain-containing protein 3-like n=1 Tax=Alosa sapidissima TaxID=34773 RepID=UPI001C0810C9|nr:NLR family CARD domain-containing protein 3-like [Alosa sapidissima]XP_041960927.1 NLR family CARD domain-containing protein 3-like [Alosa sapidissima]